MKAKKRKAPTAATVRASNEIPYQVISISKVTRVAGKTQRRSRRYQVPEVLRFQNNSKFWWARLPFNGLGRSSGWRVPRTGGYFGGCKTGHELALVYLKSLRDHGDRFGGMLQHIVLGMSESCAQARSDDERDAIKGQCVGFFTLIEACLASGAKECGAFLDKVDVLKCVRMANAGLVWDKLVDGADAEGLKELEAQI